MKRDLDSVISNSINAKPVILVGARQAGKTTLAKMIASQANGYQYFNYDVAEDRKIILKQAWDSYSSVLILDEIQKMKQWKTWLKGVIDSKKPKMKLLVTGSMKLNLLRRSGDSLAGRYLQHHLYPVTIAELQQEYSWDAQQSLEHLLRRGGFPEPCLATNDATAQQWHNQYARDIIRNDLLELDSIRSISSIDVLYEELRSKVGSPLSITALARDIGLSHHLVQKYLTLFEAVFLLFKITPWHKNIAHANKLQPKYYFYDVSQVKRSRGVTLENIVAIELHQWVQLQNDLGKGSYALHYIRTKDDAEVDFVISNHNTPTLLIECKQSDGKPSKSLINIAKRCGNAETIQLVEQINHPYKVGSVAIQPMAQWLVNYCSIKIM
ncbi:MAG: ATP-binding protein [Methylacidiphilales bacterium]|nr:ATP-binding protein [Candidatus Methylacidiphilales bacterium]